MKKIFIVLYPSSMSVDDLFGYWMMPGIQEIEEVLKEHYHMLLFANTEDKWDFKLLKGTEEEYSQLSEITEKILLQEVI